MLSLCFDQDVHVLLYANIENRKMMCCLVCAISLVFVAHMFINNIVLCSKWTSTSLKVWSVMVFVRLLFLVV